MNLKIDFKLISLYIAFIGGTVLFIFGWYLAHWEITIGIPIIVISLILCVDRLTGYVDKLENKFVKRFESLEFELKQLKEKK